MTQFKLFNIKLLGAIIALSYLTACTTVDPYTGREKVSSATVGTGVGAATGAAVGALVSGNKGKGALIGAGIGAVAGGAIGYHMDQQEAVLRDRLRNTGVSVTRYGDRIILNLPSSITFDPGRSTLKPQFHSVLDSVGIVLNKYKNTLVEVAGHTDNTGSTELNQILSDQRANSVATYLRSTGVAAGRLVTTGYGESQPIATNRTAEGRATNRRVEITLSPMR